MYESFSLLSLGICKTSNFLFELIFFFLKMQEENESRPLKRVLKNEVSSRSNGCDELSSGREEIKRL